MSPAVLVYRALPTHDGRARVLLARSAVDVGVIAAKAEALGGRDLIGIIDTIDGREVRSYDERADAYVASLLAGGAS